MPGSLGPHAVDAAAHAHLPVAPLSAAPPAPAAPPPASARAVVYGYAPYWEDAMDQDWDRLTHLAVFSVGVDGDGGLTSLGNWTGVAPEVVPVAHAHGVRVHLCVTSFYDSEHDAILPSSSRRTALVRNLADQVAAYGADGVNVDFEGLDADLRDEFSLFVEELAAAVGDVYLATPAVDWSRAFDYERLAAASEGLFIMGYGYHWTGGDPGPNDPLYASSRWGTYALDWTVQDYLDHGVAPEKIIVGLPLYGQEWPAGTEVPGSAWGDGWSVTLGEAEDIRAREGGSWDEPSTTAYVLRSGTQLWFDDEPALEARMRWAVQDQGLAGVGFWALGYEDGSTTFWDMVADATALPDTSTDTGPTGGTDSGPTGSDDTGPADRGGPPGAKVLSGEVAGCGCGTSGAGASGWAALLGLGLLGWRRGGIREHRASRGSFALGLWVPRGWSTLRL